MTDNKIKPALIPNVSYIKNKEHLKTKHNDFNQVLENKLQEESISGDVILSTHAAKRIKDRNLDFNGEEFIKIRDAITKLKAKGGKDSLVITNKAAYIVDVGNKKIVTAFDKNDLKENIFTKIDSTILIN